MLNEKTQQSDDHIHLTKLQKNLIGWGSFLLACILLLGIILGLVNNHQEAISRSIMVDEFQHISSATASEPYAKESIENVITRIYNEGGSLSYALKSMVETMAIVESCWVEDNRIIFLMPDESVWYYIYADHNLGQTD